MPSRRHLHLLIALLLPLMVVRGLLPAGFMPVAQDGELRMVLCSDGLELPAGGKGSGDHAPGSGGDCLFAHAAASAPPQAIVSLTPFGPVEGPTFHTPRAQQWPGVIPRAQAPRGPPVLQ